MKNLIKNKTLKELLDSNLFRTLFAVFLAVGCIIYCAVSLSIHFVWFDLLTGIPIALVLATVGNVFLTVKNEYLSDVDEDEKISSNILSLLLIILYHVLFTLATLTSFLVLGNLAQADSETSPFVAALNLSFGVIAIAQPFIYNRLDDNDKEWLTVFGFIFFYAALYLVNVGIGCLEVYAIHSNKMIILFIVAGVVSGATLIFGIVRIVISIKNIVVHAGRTVVEKLTPQSVVERRQMKAELKEQERNFKEQERKNHPQFFKFAREIRKIFFKAVNESSKISVDVTVNTNAEESYGSNYNQLEVYVKVLLSRHLPTYYSSAMKHSVRQEYFDKLYAYLKALALNISAETGYNGGYNITLEVI